MATSMEWYSWESLLLVLTLGAEIAVAWAIFSESETTRRFHFIDKTTKDEKNKDRAEIYRKFLEVEGADRNAKSMAFVGKMWSDNDIKRKCDSQIEMLNDLGLIIGSELSWRKEFYVKIFPHTAAYIWVILNPYVLQRRNDAGPLFAQPMLNFMKECVQLLIEQGRDIHLRNGRGEIGLTLGHKDLVEIKAEIDDAIAMV